MVDLLLNMRTVVAVVGASCFAAGDGDGWIGCGGVRRLAISPLISKVFPVLGAAPGPIPALGPVSPGLEGFHNVP